MPVGRQVQVEGWESDWSSDLLDLDTTEQLALSDTPIEATRRLEAVMRQSVDMPVAGRGRKIWAALLVVGLVEINLNGKWLLLHSPKGAHRMGASLAFNARAGTPERAPGDGGQHESRCTYSVELPLACGRTCRDPVVFIRTLHIGG